MSNIDVDGISERALIAHLFSMPYDVYSVVTNYVAAIRDENTRLRELMHDFDKWLSEAEYVAYVQGHGTIHDYTTLVSLRSRMRELGIEADE
ncbi:MAG: hypothetical protein IKE22_12400 [Atopobiaceae bacterium]|nr:hypothetical protein [Atopobiaceae bacterium]